MSVSARLSLSVLRVNGVHRLFVWPRLLPLSTTTLSLRPRDDNGSAGHGSSGSTNLSGSRGSRASTRDPLTHDKVNKIPRTGYFVAVMMFDFESTST